MEEDYQSAAREAFIPASLRSISMLTSSICDSMLTASGSSPAGSCHRVQTSRGSFLHLPGRFERICGAEGPRPLHELLAGGYHADTRS